ncbi:MAG: sugar ABC transporter ATP-binding protein [Saccharofermentanales bacterium]
MSQTLLELKDIVKTFPGVLALNGINFDLKAGEIHAICGENGAGKSTLMKVVSGVFRPDKGEIHLNGEVQHFNNPLESYKKGISIIYQETSLFEEMTVLENMFLGHEEIRKIAGVLPYIDYRRMEKDARRIFDRLNSSIDINAKIKTLGMAQKQMVEIAKALTFDAKILILDEPTASLTQREVDALFDIIRKLRDEGVGIVYISHRLEEIFVVCDRVTVIRDGNYISTNTVSETCKDNLVKDMVGRSMSSYYPKTETEIGEVLMETRGLSVHGLLDNINFHIRRGEILGFAGLAGSGRTELAQTLCGILKKTHGDVYVEDKKVHIRNYNDAMENGIVYVSEDRGKYGLIVQMSVKYNITMPQLEKFTTLGLLDDKKESAVADRYIKDVGIKAPGGDFLVTNLSGGNQQKVSVAKALALTPKILILDEPTRGVDVNAKAEIHKMISELTAKGLTILMISSELPELLGMCDRIYVMQEGEIAGCFSREEATQEKILKLALEI